MENRVITIARSYGSGGRKMGRLLAKELGYEYYDREILRIASDESGISEELFNQVDERQHLPLFRIAREAYTGEAVSYTHLDVYKRQHRGSGKKGWNPY